MTALTHRPCANPACRLVVPAYSHVGLCHRCEDRWRKFSIPTAGYISSLDLKVIGREFLQHHAPTQSETTEILRILRGTRHPTGDWAKRPPPRLAPLLHGRCTVRRSHVLVGRRRPPSMVAFGMAIAHHVLARTVIGIGSPYAQFVTGCTFYNRRAVTAADGVEIAKNTGKVTGYRLQTTDFNEVGRVVLRAGRKVGIEVEGRAVTAWITSRYARGLDAGEFHRPVVVSPHADPTTAGGDHPFDHYLGHDPATPSRYRNALRRASGRIGREYPEEVLDLSWEEIAARRKQPRRSPQRPTIPPPSTDWLFK